MVLENEEYEMVIATGDFQCLSTVNILSKYSKTEVLAVTGNLDDPQIADELDYLGFNVENKVKVFGGITFAGVSGQSPLTSIKQLNEKDFDVLLSHYPPKGVVDRAWSGTHIGLAELKELIELKKPLLVSCGHVHESRGYDLLNGTLVVNSGALKDGYYAIEKIYMDKVNVELRLIEW